MIDVHLTQEDIQSSLNFVDAMRSDKREHSVIDRKFDKNNSSWAVNLMGHLGERAVAKAYSTLVDDRILTAGDEGHDLIINGKTIQVKTSVTNQLIFKAKHLFSADYSILVQLIGDRLQPHVNSYFKIWGDISRERFLDVCFEKDYGYGTRYVCNATDLGWELNGKP